jgi:ribosomal protein S18 acetylase RimI-like enzyme
MNCRFAEQRDLPVLARIHVATWRAAYRGMMPAAFLDALDDAHALARLRPALEVSPPRVHVVELDNEVVAFSRFGPSRESDVPPLTFEVFALNVEPAHWRRGIGRGLVESVLEVANAQGFEACTLWVLRDNERARRFYEAVGFEVDGATRIEAADSAQPLHEVRYRRLL